MINRVATESIILMIILYGFVINLLIYSDTKMFLF